MITLTVLAFIFMVGVLVIIVSIAAEGMVIFPIIDIIIAILILRLLFKGFSSKK